jgi:hypothetical protein
VNGLSRARLPDSGESGHDKDVAAASDPMLRDDFEPGLRLTLMGKMPVCTPCTIDLGHGTSRQDACGPSAGKMPALPGGPAFRAALSRVTLSPCPSILYTHSALSPAFSELVTWQHLAVGDTSLSSSRGSL